MSTDLGFSTKGLQSVCSTGISTFDDLIGGGFALTSINIIDEDQFQIYSSMLLKAYLSSAIYAEQDLIIFSPSVYCKKSRFIRELPSIKASKQDSMEGNKISHIKELSKMKIAFRYSNLPSRFNENTESKRLDFSDYIDSKILEESNIEFYNHSDLIKILQEKLQKTQFGEIKNSKVCRILIEQFGSPLSCFTIKELPKILHQLKILMRRLTKSVCLIGLVSSSNNNYDLLETNPEVRTRLYFESDSVTRFISFENSTFNQHYQNPYSQDYVGLVQLLRLSRLNSFVPYNPSLATTDYGLKIHGNKRYLSVEKLALPPDLEETANRFTSSNQAADTMPLYSSFKFTDF